LRQASLTILLFYKKKSAALWLPQFGPSAPAVSAAMWFLGNVICRFDSHRFFYGGDHMIKAVLFDFDGVLTIDKTGSESIIKYIVSKTDILFEILSNSYYSYNNGLLLGEYTHKDIWANLCRDVNTNIDYNLLLEAFENTLLDNDMLVVVKELKKTYKIGMITDNKRDRIEAVSEINKFNEIFDVISVSADVHSCKDDKAIFEQTIAALGVSPNECIFIDNTPDNLIAPRLMGMTTILYNDENKNIDEFKNTLNKCMR
jgi:putative hydrolase of the HAD superfamily